MPLLAILLSWNHIRATFQLTLFSSPEKGIKVLSYNTRVFNVYNHLGKKDKWKSTKDMTKWIVDGNFDIMCFQEFYYEPLNKNFNTIKNLKAKNKYNHYFYKTLTNRSDGQFGLAIFTKYKILNKGVINFNKKINNQIIYVDLKIKADTVRVYNCHLISNNLDDSEMPDSDNSTKKNGSKIKKLASVLKKGFAKRANQIDSLIKDIDKCPYKIILCGDLNDLPYSYTYKKLKSNLDNCFEQKGNGMGFSYNGKIPFLRIDQIFVSEQIQTKSFVTHFKVKYSDHFPISTTLVIK